jgi:hypothetical protein
MTAFKRKANLSAKNRKKIQRLLLDNSKRKVINYLMVELKIFILIYFCIDKI